VTAPAADPVAGPLVVLLAGGARLALPRESVRALLPLPRLDRPPGLPEPLAGFLDLHGTAVAVVDLARLLGLPPGPAHPYRHLVLLAGSDGPPALLVDRVTDVIPPGAALRPAGEGTSLGEAVAGAVATPGGTAHLLDPARLLLAREAAVLDALAAQARDRLGRWGLPPGSLPPDPLPGDAAAGP